MFQPPAVIQQSQSRGTFALEYPENESDDASELDLDAASMSARSGSVDFADDDDSIDEEIEASNHVEVQDSHKDMNTPMGELHGLTYSVRTWRSVFSHSRVDIFRQESRDPDEVQSVPAAQTSAKTNEAAPVPGTGLLRLPRLAELNSHVSQEYPEVLRSTYYKDGDAPDFVLMPVLKTDEEVAKLYVSTGHGLKAQEPLTLDNHRCNEDRKFKAEQRLLKNSPRGRYLDHQRKAAKAANLAARKPSAFQSVYVTAVQKSVMCLTLTMNYSSAPNKVAISNLVNKDPVEVTANDTKSLKRKASVLEVESDDDMDEKVADDYSAPVATPTEYTTKPSVDEMATVSTEDPNPKRPRTIVGTTDGDTVGHTVGTTFGNAINATAYMLVGSAATIGLLCSPLAERLLQS